MLNVSLYDTDSLIFNNSYMYNVQKMRRWSSDQISKKLYRELILEFSGEVRGLLLQG